MKPLRTKTIITCIAAFFAFSLCIILSGCGGNGNVSEQDSGTTSNQSFDMTDFRIANSLTKIFEEHDSVSYQYDIYTASGTTHEIDYFSSSGNDLFAVVTDEQMKSGQHEFSNSYLAASNGDLYAYYASDDEVQMIIDTSRNGAINLNGFFDDGLVSEKITSIEDHGNGELKVTTDLSQDESAINFVYLAGATDATSIIGTYIIDAQTLQIKTAEATAISETSDTENGNTSDNQKGTPLYSCTAAYDVESPEMVSVMKKIGLAADPIAAGKDDSAEKETGALDNVERTNYTFVIDPDNENIRVNASVPVGMKFALITDSGYALYEDRNGTTPADSAYTSTGFFNDGVSKTFYLIAN